MEILGLDQIEVQNTPIDELDSEVVNLINVAIDQSGSMDSYETDMKKSLIDFKDSTAESKEADTILVARTNFMNDIVDISGYKKIDEFDTDFYADGQTPLYDAIIEGVDKLTNQQGTGYMDYLKQQGMRVKSVFAVFSDGEDTSSHHDLSAARAKIDYLNKREIVTACICFGQGGVSEAKQLGFKNILTVGASASELRRAFNCLSKSVAENSKSVVNKVNDFFEV
jgi:uncharacterized protein YegL